MSDEILMDAGEASWVKMVCRVPCTEDEVARALAHVTFACLNADRSASEEAKRAEEPLRIKYRLTDEHGARHEGLADVHNELHAEAIATALKIMGALGYIRPDAELGKRPATAADLAARKDALKGLH